MDIKTTPNIDSLVDDIQDFMNNPKFQPKDQNKWFFSDGMSYYQQLLEIFKILTYFQDAFKIVQENENTIASAYESLIVLPSQVEEIKAELVEFNNKYKDVPNRVTELETKVSELLETTKSELSRIESLESDNTTNKSNISALQSDNETNKTNISALQSDNTTNKANIKSLQDDNTTNKANIKSLQDDNTTNKSKIATLEDDNASNQINIANNTKNIATKQDKLISGTNIKTINDTSLLGEGNIELATSQELEDTNEHVNTIESNVSKNASDIADINAKDYLSLVKFKDSANITFVDEGKQAGVQTFTGIVTGSTPANLSENLTYANANTSNLMVGMGNTSVDDTGASVVINNESKVIADGVLKTVQYVLANFSKDYFVKDSAGNVSIDISKLDLEKYLTKESASTIYATIASLTNETNARTSADNILQSSINKKADTTTVTALNTSLTSEISRAKSAESTLQTNIDKKANQSDLTTTNTNLAKLTDGQSLANGTDIDTITDNGFYHQVGDWSGTLPSLEGYEWHYSNLLAFSCGSDVVVQILFHFVESVYCVRVGRGSPTQWYDWSINTTSTYELATKLTSELATIKNSITTETNARTSADNTLQTNIDKKADTTTVTALNTSLTSEISRAKSAESTLQTNINAKANQSDLASEIANRKNEDTILKTSIDNKQNKPTTYSNISVSVTSTKMSSSQSWDSEKKYGYSATVTLSGLATTSLILNIVMTDTLLDSVAPIVTTGANSLTFYTEDATALSGTIYTLVTSEVE